MVGGHFKKRGRGGQNFGKSGRGVISKSVVGGSKFGKSGVRVKNFIPLPVFKWNSPKCILYVYFHYLSFSSRFVFATISFVGLKNRVEPGTRTNGLFWPFMTVVRLFV